MRRAHPRAGPLVTGNPSRHPWIHPTLVCGALLLLYLASAPRTVCLEEDGLFLMTAYTNGIAQPAGYPLLTLLGHLASLLPLGTRGLAQPCRERRIRRAGLCRVVVPDAAPD